MTVLWVIIGVVLLMVIWGFVSATTGKTTAVRTDPTAPPPMPAFESPEKELPKAKSWQDARTASVSKNFGKGGEPTGISKDVGTAVNNADEDIERLKNARAFEPRITATSTKYEDT